ncbi:MAG: DUF177 domain-containing protein [Chitinophagales bacterium]|nr:DUF177 domain-containing protein [Chitinophagales bacterium]MDW8273907.1 DUF177 domain-containing protein [Chitinophagales bacterium]
MKGLRDFSIPFVGLKLGIHEFFYDLDKAFFDHFPDSPIGECDVKVKLEFDKKETFFILNFFIDGKVTVECDRCLALYEKEIFGDYSCVIKLTDNSPRFNDDDEIIYISKDDTHFDVSHLLYEYVALCLPLRKIPCREPGLDERCDKEVLKYLRQHVEDTREQDIVDPRWEALKKWNSDLNN